MFETRRPATPEEIDRLLASVDVMGPEDVLALLREAQVSEIGTVEELGRAFTVLGVTDPPPGGPYYRTVADIAADWEAGGGTPERDRPSYLYHRELAADLAYEPILVFAPTSRGSATFWLFDGIHRAAALHAVRKAAGVTRLSLPVFVCPRPVFE